MTGTNSPCGACKFLRRKCVRGCVFAPHFCYEEGSSHFAAIHKVFGASNASKILAHLPPADRSEAAVAISYEAQARLQDPVYGCVSHIFALQQQVVNLQAQLSSLKEQVVNVSNNNSITSNSNDYRKMFDVESQFYPDQDVQSWFQDTHRTKFPEFDGNNFDFDTCIGPKMPYPSTNNGNSCFPDDSASFGSMQSLEMQYSNEQGRNDRDELQSVAFGYNYSNPQLS